MHSLLFFCPPSPHQTLQEWEQCRFLFGVCCSLHETKKLQMMSMGFKFPINHLICPHSIRQSSLLQTQSSCLRKSYRETWKHSRGCPCKYSQSPNIGHARIFHLGRKRDLRLFDYLLCAKHSTSILNPENRHPCSKLYLRILRLKKTKIPWKWEQGQGLNSDQIAGKKNVTFLSHPSFRKRC